jgi:LmbE family N-acetylglucosaminyl deacetylase
MLKFEPRAGKDRPLSILCLGAHSDDIEIGCGGTILRMIEKNRNNIFYWVVFSADEKRKEEAFAGARLFLEDAGEKTTIIKNFRDGYFPYIGMEIKEYFEELKKTFLPDLIFTHYRHDLHQDHRLISELTWNTFRDHAILEYEVPKYDGDLGLPNVFVHLDEAICEKKIKYIFSIFKTQSGNHWFAKETFLSILWMRGIESNAPGKFAEAFYGRKTVLE